MITSDILNSKYNYDCDSGILTNKKGRLIGSIDKDGYLVTNFKIDNKKHYMFVHRIIWIMNNGIISTDVSIDHINRIKTDNRMCNLRLSDSQSQQYNKGLSSKNTTGYKGVSPFKDMYIAQCKVNKRSIRIGVYHTKEEAKKAYDNFAIKNHGEYFCAG